MKKFLRMFFNLPESREELVYSESMGAKIVSIVFILTSIFIFYVCFKVLPVIDASKGLSLSVITVLNGFAYLGFSMIAYKQAKKIQFVKNLDELESIKVLFYKKYLLIIGVPYLAILLWAFVNNQTSFFINAFCIFSITIISVYYFDWYRFKKSKPNFLKFYNG